MSRLSDILIGIGGGYLIFTEKGNNIAKYVAKQGFDQMKPHLNGLGILPNKENVSTENTPIKSEPMPPVEKPTPSVETPEQKGSIIC